jgi:hypothetical protein
MKLISKIITGACALALLTLAAGSLQAQVTNIVSISFTATEQNTNQTDNGTVTTTPAPSKHSATTSTILDWLAADENTEGHYAQTSFPAGAKLVAISGGGNAPDLQVVAKNNSFLVDVSDILSITNNGPFGADVSSGKNNDTNSLAAPTKTDQEYTSLVYNDSLSTSNYLFSFGGITVNTTTDTTPKDGIYKETESHTISSGQGDGLYFGTQFVITGGSFKAGGSGELSDVK